MTIHIELDSIVKFVVIVALFLLIVFFVYPFLKGKLKEIIKRAAKRIEVAEQLQNQDKPIVQAEEKPSFVGENKINLRQSTPNTATVLETEKVIEKVATFVSSTDSDPEIRDVDVALEKIENLPEEEFDAEEETEELAGFDRDSVPASGLVYEDLAKTQQVIAAPVASEQEEKDAGKVIYENLKTEMFVKLTESGNTQTAMRISNLLDIHLGELAKEQQTEQQISMRRSKQLGSSDFKDFDINSIFT